MLGYQFEVGLVQDDLGQVLLSLDLLPDGVWHIRNDVGQDELRQVNNVLRAEDRHEFTSVSLQSFSAPVRDF